MILRPSFCAASIRARSASSFGQFDFAGRLDVVDLRRNFRFAADPDQFIERLEQLVSLAPHVRNIFALIFRRDLAELDQLRRFGVKGRRIDQRGADAERAGFHLLADQRAHLVELLRRRRLVFEPDHILANRGRADERGDVAGDAALLRETADTRPASST